MESLLVVVDLCGTLTDTSHRQHLWDEGRIDEFHALSFFDPPNEAVCDASNRLYCTGAHVEIWTGRVESKRRETLSWLRHAVVRFSRLRMRANDDLRPTEALMEERCRTLHRLPDMAWDDRIRALQKWADMGVQPVAVDQNVY